MKPLNRFRFIHKEKGIIHKKNGTFFIFFCFLFCEYKKYVYVCDMKNEQNNTQKIGGKFYNALLAHCSKQYKNIATIQTAYIVNKQVWSIDYIDHKGILNITRNIHNVISDKIIYFK